jgi:hypothetical protein
MAKRIQHEQILQIECVKEFYKKYPTQEGRLYSNYNKPPSAFIGMILRREGMLSGIADLSYLLEGGRIVYIEMKHGKNKQSPAQKEFEARVVALGFPYYLCNSLEGFMQIIEKYNAENLQ